MKNTLFLILIFVFSISYAQTKEQIKQITSSYDIEKLTDLSNSFSEKYQMEKEEALRLAAINGWKVKYTEDGVYYELQRVTKDGKPIYYMTHNKNAAKSTRADHLHNGGILGLNVEGQNMTAYVWDGGIARATHQEYDGPGGTDRFSAGDSGTLSDHSAHVMGTIIASGFVGNAKGMAPQAQGIGYDWNSDEAEAATAAANGMLISNHSYGPDIANASYPDWAIGAYTQQSFEWDLLFYNSPYYLQLVSAGNDGTNNTANGDPLEGNQFFDKLSGDKSTSKNNMAVANAHDAVVNPDGTLISVNISSSSSEGPTDDLRIKPEITGNGEFLYSTLDNSNSSYASYSGTSMSSPNVAGSLLLLQQHYMETYGTFMRASTLKGLAMHTADDTAGTGPDAVWGWGLLNTMAGAEVISNNGLSAIVVEKTLNDGESYTVTVESDNTNPLLASISWTDPANTNTTNNGIPNDPTPVLINDLDLRVSNGTEYFPWKLTSVTSNDQADNIVDPFERVDVVGASGTYTITVTHKGTLTDGKQDFALVITGVDSEFTFDPIDYVVEECAPNNAEFDFDFRTATGSSSNTTFSAQNLPAGASASFSPNPINSDGTVTMTVSGLSSVTPGEYTIDISAQSTSETETSQVTLLVYNPSLNTPSLYYPAQNAVDVPYSIDLTWSSDFNAQNYDVEVAEDSNFTNIVYSATVDTASYSAHNLDNNTTYYWRVKPVNMCASGSFTASRQFTTTDACVSYEYGGSPIGIPDLGSVVTSTLDVTANFTVEDVNVFVDITHADVGALLISLTSPSGTNTYVSTPDTNCNVADIFANYDGAGVPIYCDNSGSYGYHGNLQPSADFGSFNGENSVGTWTLNVLDLEPGNTGTINNWTLNVCDENVIGVGEIEFEDLSIWPNPTNGEVTIALSSNNDDIAIALFDISGRLITEKMYTNPASNFKENIDFGSLSNGIYVITIANGNQFSTRKLVVDKN